MLHLIFTAAIVFGQSAEKFSTAKEWLEAHPTAMLEYTTKCREHTAKLLHDGVDRANELMDKSESEITRISNAPISNSRKAVKKDGVTVVYPTKESKASAMKAAEKLRDEAGSILKSVEKYSKRVVLVPLKSTAIDDIGSVSSIKVIQIADGKSARVSFDEMKDEVWLLYPTSRFVNGKAHAPKEPHVAIIIGTKEYSTSAGSVKTIPLAVLEPAPRFEEDSAKK